MAIGSTLVSMSMILLKPNIASSAPPTEATAPITGRLAAARPPKTSTMTIRVSGSVTISPKRVSLAVCFLTSCWSTRSPPTVTCAPSAVMADRRWVTVSSCALLLPSAIRTVTRLALPSVERRAAAPGPWP